MYLKPWQTFMIELNGEFNGVQPLTIFAKNLIIDV